VAIICLIRYDLSYVTVYTIGNYGGAVT